MDRKALTTRTAGPSCEERARPTRPRLGIERVKRHESLGRHHDRSRSAREEPWHWFFYAQAAVEACFAPEEIHERRHPLEPRWPSCWAREDLPGAPLPVFRSPSEATARYSNFRKFTVTIEDETARLPGGGTGPEP